MKWNGRNYKPLLPQKIRFQEEKFDVEEYMKSLQEKHDRVPVWRSVPNPLAVNVSVGEEPVPPPFQPDDISGLVGWWKSTEGLTFGSGGILTWDDVVSGNTATSGAPNRFNNSTDVLNGISGITQVQPNTNMTIATQLDLVTFAIFVVLKVNTAKIINYFIGNASGEGLGAYNTAVSPNGPLLFLNPGRISGGSNILTPQYLTYNRDAASGIIRQNGTQISSGALAADTFEVNRLFEGNIGSSLSLAGTIWEICIYNRDLSNGEIIQVENYLTSKYNL